MFRILIQRATRKTPTPSATALRRWAEAALKSHLAAGEITIRIVDENEMITLNTTYRHKNKVTNILSFPFDMPKDIELTIPLIGDLVICAAVVVREAKEQHKTPDAHWAHMIVHGTLHLLGYDHEEDAAATNMEAHEIAILKTLGFKDPYKTNKQEHKHE